MASNEKPKVVKLMCDDGREKTSIENLLNKIEQTDDDVLSELFDLMPYEVMDIKDTLRRSNI